MFELNGEMIPASASRSSIIYENIDLPVAIYWTNNGEIVPGEHQVELYEGGKLMGAASFLFK